MKRNARRTLVNFYDALESEKKERFASAISPSTYVHHIDIPLDEEPRFPTSHPLIHTLEESTPQRLGNATLTLVKLQESVMGSKKTLEYVDALILQAVWKCILQNSKRRRPERGEHFSFSSNSPSERQCAARLGVATSPSFNNQMPRGALLSKFQDETAKKDLYKSLALAKSSLPINTFPKTLLLNCKNDKPVNRESYDTREKMSRFHPKKSLKLQKLTGNATCPTTLRSMVLKYTMENNYTKNLEVSTATQLSSLLNSSVSLLILDFTKKRALATLFLRQLRLHIFRRRYALEEFHRSCTCRFKSWVLRTWHGFALARQSKKQTLAKRIVDHWQRVVEHQKRLRSTMHHFHAGITKRLRATEAYQNMRRTHLFRDWKSKFMKRRLSCVESEIAEPCVSLHCTYASERSGMTPSKEYMSVSLSNEELSDEPTTSQQLLEMSHLFKIWRSKTAEKLKVRLLDCRYVHRVKKRALEKLKKVANQRRAVRCVEGTEPSFGTLALNRSPAVSPSPLDDVDRRYRPCCRILTQMSSLQETFSYKAKMSLRVVEKKTTQRVFQLWRQHYLCRRADEHWMNKTWFATMRRWMDLLLSRRVNSVVKKNVWQHWWARLQRRYLGNLATALYVRNVFSRTFYAWRLSFVFRSCNKVQVARWCLRHWWVKVATQVGTATLDFRHRQRLFYKWKEQTSIRSRCRVLLFVADRLRKTILLVGCVRVWRQRVKKRNKSDHFIHNNRLSKLADR